MVDVELASVTNRLQSTITRIRYVQMLRQIISDESWTDTRIPWDIQLISNEITPLRNPI